MDLCRKHGISQLIFNSKAWKHWESVHACSRRAAETILELNIWRSLAKIQLHFSSLNLSIESPY